MSKAMLRLINLTLQEDDVDTDTKELLKKHEYINLLDFMFKE